MLRKIAVQLRDFAPERGLGLLCIEHCRRGQPQAKLIRFEARFHIGDKRFEEVLLAGVELAEMRSPWDGAGSFEP